MPIFLREVRGKINRKRFCTEDTPVAFERATAQGLEPVPAGLELRVMREGMQHISVFRCLVMKKGGKSHGGLRE